MILEEQPLGIVMGGSLLDGFTVKISPAIDLESVRTGMFVVISGIRYRFFAIVTDIRLTISQPDIFAQPPQDHELLLKRALTIRDIYALATIRPLLMCDAQGTLFPVTTLPAHFAPVHTAQHEDIKTIFGCQDKDKRFFAIGSPLDMNTPLCVDLQRVTERSVGIFGKTGTGKTFITRLLLAGIIGKKAGVCLIFDMHSEYGHQARTEQRGGGFVKGLKTLFPHRVIICSLDKQMKRPGGISPDLFLQIPYSSLRPEDLMSLSEELHLHSTACEAAYLLGARYQKDWLTVLLSSGDRLKEVAAAIGAHAESVAALYRKLKPIEQFPFLSHEALDPTPEDSLSLLTDHLSKGFSVIIEFGSYNSTLCYLLIANSIARRVHHLYTIKTEAYLHNQQRVKAPEQLIIVIEEAHKFLNPVAAKQTIFGIIAREMRKYSVSLMIVDQRPSGIDSEILSQVGTKLVAQLSDEKDIISVLCGTGHALYMRGLLSSLATKQQLLIFGHAVPMPIIITTRLYNEQFYRDIVAAQEMNGSLETAYALYE